MARNFREWWYWAVPSWIAKLNDPTDEGAKVLHSLAIIKDATIQRLRDGLNARFPTRTGESANANTAADRGLIRGRSETLAAFAARLNAWRTPRTHRVRGSAYGLLEQVFAYWGTGTEAYTVDHRGQRYYIDGTGQVSRSEGFTSWNWDANAQRVTPTQGASSDTHGGGNMTPTIPANAPGSLLFINAFAEAGGTIATPVGWTLIESNSPSGTNLHVLLGRVSDGTEGTTVEIVTTGTNRAIAIVVQVPGEWFADVLENIETSVEYEGSGTSILDPDLGTSLWANTTLAFVGYDSGGTATPFRDGGGTPQWTEVGSEAVAGSAGGGVGMQAQYHDFYQNDTASAYTITLSDTASWGVIAVRLRAPWARFWIVWTPDASLGVDLPPSLGNPALWGGTLGTPGYTLGQTVVTPADVLAMRNLFQQYAWHPEHTRPEWLILSVDGANPSPDGGWRHWSNNVAGTQTAARHAHYRYWSLSPAENNTYAGNPASFATDTYMVDDVPYGGDPTNAAAWDEITLPNGELYQGDSASFPAAVLLLDDGAIPE